MRYEAFCGKRSDARRTFAHLMGEPMRSLSPLSRPVLIFLSLAACAPAPIETVPIGDVLTQLKRELAAIKPEATLPANASDTCYGSGHTIRIVASPVKAIAEFKTVVTTGGGASGSANIPAGASGVIVAPSIDTSYSNIGTTALTLHLGIQHQPPTTVDLEQEISTLHKYITARRDDIKDLESASNPAARTAIDKLQVQIKNIQSRLTNTELVLADREEQTGPAPTPMTPFFVPRSPPPIKPLTLAAPPVSTNVSISKVFNTAIEGLLTTSHRQPCFLPQQLDVKVNFEAVRKVSGGVAVAFLVAKVGANASKTDDATQSVTVSFDLSQGTAAVK